MNNNTFLSKKFVFTIATMFPALMLVASSMTPFAPIEAFAQEGSDSMPMMMSQDMQLNMEIDLDLVFDEEDCQDANDQTTQQISQSDDQYGESSGAFPVIGTSVNTGMNIAVTPDVVLTDACGGPTADQTTQGLSQSSNQQGEGDKYFASVLDGRNIAHDDNVYVPVF